MIRRLFRRLRQDDRGATLIEFAMVVPVMLVVIMGLLDMTYRLYATAVFQGAVQKASRAGTLASNNTSQIAIDTAIKDAFKEINSGVTDSSFVFTRRNFSNFTNADKLEPSTGPGGICAAGYTYADLNNSNSYDDGAQSGQGGAQDAVLYTAQVTYQSIFPVASLYGAPRTPTIKATTILRNQPFATQGARNVGTTRNCP
ncbi:MAG: TadE/TadG family type IV pilus assembly protein [Sphingomonadales bacterium]